jgi:hypothetical protein
MSFFEKMMERHEGPQLKNHDGLCLNRNSPFLNGHHLRNAEAGVKSPAVDFPLWRRIFPLPSLGPVAVDNCQTDFNLFHHFWYWNKGDMFK